MRFLASLFVITLILSCSTTKMSDSENGELVLHMSKGACFGTCPVYDVFIHDNGLMKLNVRKMENKQEGTYMRQLTKDEYKTFQKFLKRAELEKADAKYDENVADAPETIIDYMKDSKNITVKYKFSAPNTVIDLASYIHSLVRNDEKWNRYVEDTSAELTPSRDLIVFTNEANLINNVIKDVMYYKPSIKKTLNESRGEYILTFDTKVDINRIAEELRRNSNVKRVLSIKSSNTSVNNHKKVNVRDNMKADR